MPTVESDEANSTHEAAQFAGYLGPDAWPFMFVCPEVREGSAEC